MNNKENKSSIDLLDIVRGYSVLTSSDSQCYFKHFTVLKLLELDNIQEIDITKSIKSGIKTEKDLLETAIKRKFWSVKNEEKIKSLNWTIKKSLTAFGKIEDLKQRELFKNQIDSQENELKEIKVRRANITAYSAENLSEVKRVKRMFKQSVFMDLDFTESPSQEQELIFTTAMFSRYAELNNRETILKASYFGGFFDLFSAQEGDRLALLDKTFKNITNFQKYLIVVSNGLLNKIKNTNIPEEIYGDPVRMMNYEEKEEKDTKVSHGIDDLRRKSQARGGELKAEDFLS